MDVDKKTAVGKDRTKKLYKQIPKNHPQRPSTIVSTASVSLK
jgi:hypothetical protein